MSHWTLSEGISRSAAMVGKARLVADKDATWEGKGMSMLYAVYPIRRTFIIIVPVSAATKTTEVSGLRVG